MPGPGGGGLADEERARSVTSARRRTRTRLLELPPPPWAPTRLRLCLAPDRVLQLRRLGLDDDAVRIADRGPRRAYRERAAELQDGLVDASCGAPLAEASAHQARQAVEAVRDLIRPMETAEEHEASLEAMRAARSRRRGRRRARRAVRHERLAAAARHLATRGPAPARPPRRARGARPRAPARRRRRADALHRRSRARSTSRCTRSRTTARATCRRCRRRPSAMLRLCPAVRAWRPERGELRLSASQLARTPQVRAVLDALALNGLLVRRLAGNKYALAVAELAALLGVVSSGTTCRKFRRDVRTRRRPNRPHPVPTRLGVTAPARFRHVHKCRVFGVHVFGHLLGVTNPGARRDG